MAMDTPTATPIVVPDELCDLESVVKLEDAVAEEFAVVGVDVAEALVAGGLAVSKRSRKLTYWSAFYLPGMILATKKVSYLSRTCTTPFDTR